MPRQAEVSAAFIPQWNERRHVAVVRQRPTTEIKSGTAPGIGVSMAPAPPARDLVVLQIRADLEGRRPTPRRSLGAGRQSRAAHRLKLRSRLRDLYVLRPHPWALDVTHNAGPRDA